MFEQELSDKFKKIFDFKKVSYAQPKESDEQECLFIEVEGSHQSVKDGRVVGRVEGNCVVFSTGDKMPFGYLLKRIAKAAPTDTKDLVFFEIERNIKIIQNVVQRSFKFVYFFNSQYDPDTGSITSTTFQDGEPS